MRRRITDGLVESLKPRTTGRYLVHDTQIQGFAVRVSPNGHKAFCFVARFNGNPHPTRRSLGSCGKTSIETARNKAREWQRLVSRGDDPARPKGQNWADLCDQFYAHIKRQRRAEDVEAMLRRELKAWANKPIGTITKSDVIKAIDRAVERGSASTAHHLFAYMRRVFNYAIARDIIEHSPCDRLRPSILIGPKGTRQRILTDDELRAFWEGTGRLGYPYCQLYRLLLVTGQRRGEVNGSKRREIDPKAKLWTVPPERFKSNTTHLVPLSSLALEVLATVPQRHDPLFAVDGFSKNKRRLDRLMKCEHFVIHDLRRTVRTRLSGLKVRSEVAEMIIGHGKKGLARIYDQHEYLDEMRDALERWAEALRAIVARAN